MTHKKASFFLWNKMVIRKIVLAREIGTRMSSTNNVKMQLLSNIINIKARSDVNENDVRAVILFESCNLNYPINNWISCLFLFWDWKCIIIISLWVSVAKDGVILVQFFCSWFFADLVLLSPVSSAGSLALHLCVQTHKVGAHVTEPGKQLQNFDRPIKISHHSW